MLLSYGKKRKREDKTRIACGLQDEDHTSCRDIQWPSPLGQTSAALPLCQPPPLLLQLIAKDTLHQTPLMPGIFAREYFLPWNALSPLSSWRPPTNFQIPTNAGLLRASSAILTFKLSHNLPALLYIKSRGGTGSRGKCAR